MGSMSPLQQGEPREQVTKSEGSDQEMASGHRDADIRLKSLFQEPLIWAFPVHVPNSEKD